VDVEALLCDAATVRENLLHILGGGISQLNRSEYPAPFGVALALMLTLAPSEARDVHRLRVILQDADGAQVAQLDAEFGFSQVEQFQPGQRISMPLVLPLQQVAIPKKGDYSVEILIDSQLKKGLPFVAQAGPILPPTPPGAPPAFGG
jgi:hypothetical protein